MDYHRLDFIREVPRAVPALIDTPYILISLLSINAKTKMCGPCLPVGYNQNLLSHRTGLSPGPRLCVHPHFPLLCHPLEFHLPCSCWSLVLEYVFPAFLATKITF